jgi:hypothetical protein
LKLPGSDPNLKRACNVLRQIRVGFQGQAIPDSRTAS